MFPLYVGRTNAIIIITNKPVLSNTYYYVFYMLKIKLDFKFCKSNCVFAFPATQSYRTTILVPRQLVCTWAHAVMSIRLLSIFQVIDNKCQIYNFSPRQQVFKLSPVVKFAAVVISAYIFQCNRQLFIPQLFFFIIFFFIIFFGRWPLLGQLF